MTKAADDAAMRAMEQAIARQVRKFLSAKEEEEDKVELARRARQDAQLAAVQQLKEYGLSNTAIGRRVGLSDVRVSQILSRKDHPVEG